MERVCVAELELVRQPGTRKELVNGLAREGFTVLFKASATMDNGRLYQHDRSVFIAPHDASIELPSARGA